PDIARQVTGLVSKLDGLHQARVRPAEEAPAWGQPPPLRGPRQRHGRDCSLVGSFLAFPNSLRPTAPLTRSKLLHSQCHKVG
ncbi:hypothetical protein AB0F84_08185, partial [Streptomyces fradiae]|uniref:hypothetical protein n=1 Tax=Streptomyces fradiae TaxID=1906 RepID=UPI0033C434DD